MITFKYDTHVHTSEVSRCGKVTAEDTVKMYKNAGYDGIVITDHYYDSYFDMLGKLGWNEKIDLYLKGYKVASELGKNLGLKVLLGMEIKFLENANDYLVYGIDEKFLRENKELYKLSLQEFRALALNNGFMIFQAHPFRAKMIPAPSDMLDGVEVYNGNPRHDSHNEMAYDYAMKNQLLMLSGSDFHQIVDLARGGIIVSESINDSHQLTDIIRNNRIVELIKH